MELDDARLQAFVDIAFEYVCDQPLEAFIDPSRVLPALDDALAPERTGDFHRWLGIPLRARVLERAERSAVLLSAWLPEDVATALGERLGRPVRLPRKAIDEAVASEQVRDGVRQMVTETLENFISKAAAADPGSAGPGGGLKGMLSFGARAAAGVGKGLLGGLGDELQRQLQERARGFVDASMAAAQRRLADRIASDETAKTLGKRRQKFFQRTLSRTESEGARWIARALPWDAIDAALPRVVAHNLARAELREALEAEIRAVFSEVGREKVGALLVRAGLLEHARHWSHTQGLALARGFFATDGARAWLGGA
jgi:hypothetical protein